MRIIGLVLVCSMAFSLMAQQKAPQTLRIAVMRHGEKPKSGNNLSCAGLNRSLALPAVLDTMIGVADYIYVPEVNTGKKTSSARMFQTVSPYAIKHNLSINSKYKVNDSLKIIKDLLTKKGTVLMVWDHTHIAGLVSALGIANVKAWPANDFDSVWIIEFKLDEKGQPKSPVLIEKHQHLQPAEKCK